jgi:sodium-dependent dicarboxylate transporter 2/3/5
MPARLLTLLAGPLLFLIIALLPGPPGLSPAARLTAGITVWMAVWWIGEAVYPAVTALLPLVLFPLCGIMPLKTTSAEYGNEIIFLFLSGFLFGQTIERWGLHRRIALRLVGALGKGPAGILLGFMVATAFVSMWISNTATAVMMTPVAVALTGRSPEPEEILPQPSRQEVNFFKALMLGVAYACSIGGLATIVGTPTNAIFLAFIQQKMGTTVSFGQWILFGFPFAAILLLVCWALLLWLFPFAGLQFIFSNSETAEGLGQRPGLTHTSPAPLGPLTPPEGRLIFIFGAVILAWISGSLLWYRWWPNCNDTVVAVAGAILLFLTPSGTAKGEALLDWPHAMRIPWGIILFFGGGLALARGFDQSGLAMWMGEAMKGLAAFPPAVVLFVVLSVVVLLSEVASNIATASMMMPVLAALAVSIGAHPFTLLLSCTLAASFGFGLPIATAPNTIVFSSGHLHARDMARAGFLLDLLAVLLLIAFVYAVLPVVFQI